MKKCFFSVLLFLFALYGHAQVANNTQLVGTVSDSTGAVIKDASVTAVNAATKVEYKGVTNGDGFYTIPFVLPGTYNITVEAKGFNKTTANGATVQLNSSARTDFSLQVGDAGTEVSVSAGTAVLSTDDALIGETIGTKQVDNLPMQTRRVMELAATASNVMIGPKTSYTGNPPGVSFIGAGTREVTNSMTLDGITVMNSLISTSPVTPNPDAVSAVQVQTGNYTAQYGAYMGVHINTDTKSGTNQFHGTAYEYWQNDAMNARPYYARHDSTIPELRFHQFGGELGGPIWKDKAFFMGSYEGLRNINASNGQAKVMTDAERNGDFSALCSSFSATGLCTSGAQLRNPVTQVALPYNRLTTISPIAQKLLAYVPQENDPGQANNLNTNVPSTFNKNSTLDRVDYAVNDKIRLFARYMWEKSNSIGGNVIPSSASISPTTDSNAIIGYTHMITPTFFNDFRFGFNKFQSNNLNYFAANGLDSAGTDLGIPGFTADTASGNPGLPTINITGYQGLGAEGTNWYQDDRTIHGYDQITWTKGQHTIMAGADIRRMAIGRAATNMNRGQFTFSGNYSGDGSADFLSGYAQTVITPVYQVRGSVASWRNGYFVQDTWQATPKLTLQYGVRYEQPTVPYALNGVGRVLNEDYTALIPSSSATTGADYQPVKGFKFNDGNHNLWAPRFGASYRATDKIVVRAGGGIYYNPNHLNAYTLTTSNYPFASSVSYSGNTEVGAPATLSFEDPTGGQPGSSSAVAGTPGTYQSAFTINHYLPTPRMYQWNVDTGVELWQGAGLEFQYLGSRSLHLDYSYYPNQPLPGPGNVNARRPYQLFGQIRQIQNSGFMTYNGFTAIFRQRNWHGLDANLSYTWSHTLDTSNDANGGGTSMIQYNLKADYGNANWDVRHRFVGTATYTMPTLRNHTLDTVAGGWHVNTIVTLQSGMPVNIGLSNDVANVGGIGTQRPMFVHAPRYSCDKTQRVNCIDLTAYAMPAPYTFGNSHRNDLKGPGAIQTNLSVFKDFPVWEMVKLQFRAEAFNVFNHANPSNPTNLTLPSVANPVAGASFSIPTGNTFGQPTTTQNPARVLQLAGRISF
ncbi:MAG TPA: carboxypeptidase regulatory-like domain-containing protein [Edaphobacter sp.]